MKKAKMIQNIQWLYVNTYERLIENQIYGKKHNFSDSHGRMLMLKSTLFHMEHCFPDTIKSNTIDDIYLKTIFNLLEKGER